MMENIIQEHYLEPHKMNQLKMMKWMTILKTNSFQKQESVPNIKDQFVPKQKSVSNNIIPETITIEYISSGIID